MGVFHEDHVIFASQLIKLWIAEGFIKPKTCQSLEELAEGYLKDLIDRNLVLVPKKRYNGEIKSCIIHDLLRELCVKIAHDEKFFQIINRGDHVSTVSKNHNPRRVSIHSYILRGLHDLCTRSLLCFCGRRSNYRFLSFITSCSWLSVLDALTIRFYKFPIQILELVHLQYVAFIYKGRRKFPASISKLRNLQTLIIFRGDMYTLIRKSNTLHLPSTIWEMPQLRHLLLERSLLPDPSPAQITGKGCVILKDLQTLSGIINFKCTREVFALMPNLKKLGISYFYDTNTGWSSFEFNNFVYLHQLETLKCLFFTQSDQSNIPLRVNFAFPPKLRKLTLSGCRISWEKMTIVGSLPNLEVLKLKVYAFEGLVWEPKEGEFSRLKSLIIELCGLEHWRANSTHFPYLQHLSLIYCHNLVEIPLEIGEIPTLQMLELYGCSPSAVASAMVIQKEQQSLENNTLRVCVHSTEDYFHSFWNTSSRSLRKANGVFANVELQKLCKKAVAKALASTFRNESSL